MIENIFLTYANHSLRDEPKNFYKIFDEIASYFSIPFGLNSDFRKIIDLVLKFTEINDPLKAQEYLELLRSNPDKINIHSPSIILQQTYGYVYGYTEGYCEETCPFGGISKINALGKECFIGPERYKCYECEQKYLIHILENIIKDKEYSEIIGFSKFLKQTMTVIKTGLTIENSLNPPFKEKLNKELMWQPLNITLSIGHFLGGVISYSLGEFLLNNDRRKLKKCNRCNLFFPAKKADPRIKFCSNCSSMNKMSKEKRKEYQRRYRQKKKQEKHEILREARIDNLMKRAGCSREEAIEYIEADSMM